MARSQRRKLGDVREGRRRGSRPRILQIGVAHLVCVVGFGTPPTPVPRSIPVADTWGGLNGRDITFHSSELLSAAQARRFAGGLGIRVAVHVRFTEQSLSSERSAASLRSASPPMAPGRPTFLRSCLLPPIVGAACREHFNLPSLLSITSRSSNMCPRFFHQTHRPALVGSASHGNAAEPPDAVELSSLESAAPGRRLSYLSPWHIGQNCGSSPWSQRFIARFVSAA